MLQKFDFFFHSINKITRLNLKRAKFSWLLLKMLETLLQNKSKRNVIATENEMHVVFGLSDLS